MRLLVAVLLFAVLSRGGGAQSAPNQSVWASLGVGGSAKGILLMGSASYSRGPAVVIGRLDGVAVFVGQSLDDKALLAGLRTGKGSRFALAAVGIARARSTHKSDGGTRTNYPTRTALAFQLQAQPDFVATPLGLTLLGQAGPGDTSYLGAALTIDLGWFGGQASKITGAHPFF